MLTDWLLPFGKDLINWTDAAVIIPEARNFGHGQIFCRRSRRNSDVECVRKAYAMYGKYMETGRGVVLGIIENFELSAAAKIRW
jgi:hypothetical protein